MDTLRLNRRDGVFIAVCLVVLAAGLVVSLNYFQKAFPEASISFRCGRAESGRIAVRFLDELDALPPRGTHKASRFGYDDLAKTYLEKELGVEGARKYLGRPIRLWYWQHRWFRPSTKEEFRVFVTPEGDVVRFAHDVDENAGGARLAEADARILAERFLYSTMGLDSASLTFIESERVGRPNRDDWTFTYRARGIEPVAGSEYRYEAGIIGDRVGGYREFLHVPESWHASFSRLRSFNDLAGSVAGVGMLLTVGAMVAVLFMRIRRRQIKWRIAIAFGLVAAGLALLNRVNSLPVTLYGYDTTASWSGFIIRTVFSGVFGSLGLGLLIFFLTASAETLYRERYGARIALPHLFTFRALRTKSAFKGILLGVTLTSFFFAYQIVFYLVAGRFGAWSPSDVPYDNLLNTAMPWLAVLAMGFFPAVSEEFISRMFSIPFLQKAFRNRLTWLALIIPAFIWGFGHAGYPNQPFWIRGVEVGTAGIIIGVIMLRFGILAPLVWHYTVDAVYTALLLFRSENTYFIVTAAVATGLLVIPLLLALAAYLRKGRFEPENGLLNSDAALPEATEPDAVEAPVRVEEGPAYVRISARARWIAVALAAAGIIAVLLPVERVGKFLSYPVPRGVAIRTFADSLRASGWADPDTLRFAAFVRESESDEPGGQLAYLLKHAGGLARFNRLGDERLADGRWRVIAYVPENRLRYRGTVHARTGRIESMFIIQPEEAAGDNLTEETARSIVERALGAEGEDHAKLTLKEHRQDARPKRLDHSFVYEAPDGDSRNIGEAKYRRTGTVDGHFVSVPRRPWYKIPEAWERDRRATTALRAVRQTLVWLVIAGASVWAAALLVLRTRRGQAPWKKAFLLAIIPGAIAILAGVNDFTFSQDTYFLQIETPWTVFRSAVVIEWLVSAAVIYVLSAVMLAFLGGLYGESLPILRRGARAQSFRDAIFGVLAGIGAVLLFRAVRAWLAAWQPAWIPFSGWEASPWPAAPIPFALMLQRVLIGGLLALAVAGFAAHLWSGPMNKPLRRVLLLFAGVVAVIPQSAVEPTEWLFAAISGMLLVALVYAVVRGVIGGRPALLIAAVTSGVCLSVVAEAVGTGSAPVVVQGWLLAALALVCLLLWLSPWSRRAA